MALQARQIEPSMSQKKTAASDWFLNLRDDICAVFEEIEDAGKKC